MLRFKNNRFVAWHLGISGEPAERWNYRLLATYQHGYGTYSKPFVKPHHNVSALLEVSYHLGRQWMVRGAYGMDMGGLLGHNYGARLTVSKVGIFK